MMMKVWFWVLAACVAYTYVVYPLAIHALARLRGRPIQRDGKRAESVSVVIAAYNEEKNIRRRVQEMSGHIARSGVEGEVIVVSDGSTDGTAGAVRALNDEKVRVVEMPLNVGKAVALNAGCALSRGEIVAFADARQTWADDALPRMLEDFRDPSVGAVSGELVLEAGDANAGVGLYWRYEAWLRRQEALVHSTVGVSGAICAIRRSLYHPMPPGTILDDVYWPLRVAMQGWRVVHEPGAQAFDRLPERPRDEFRRKVRTLSSNFQLATRLPRALLPWRNPIAVQFISHKLLRLAVPWALAGMLVLSALLGGTLYRAAFWAQVAFYAMGSAGLLGGGRTHLRLLSAASSFLLLNAAAFTAFWVWITGRAGGSWKKVSYSPTPLELSGAPGGHA